MTYPDNCDVEYTYDKLGRLNKVKNSSVTYADYSYTVTGGLQTADFDGENIKGAFEQSINEWPASIDYEVMECVVKPGQPCYLTYVDKFNLANDFDNAGNVINQDYTTLDYSHEADYTYDNAYRLTGFDVDATSSTTYDRTFTYDRNGNRQTRNSDNYVYGWEDDDPPLTTGLNHLKSAHSKTYTYDANGNIATFDGNTFAYDYRNLCTGITGAVARTYSYDASGRRVKETDGSTHYYIYDGNTLIAEYTGSTLTAKYIYGNGKILKVDGSGIKWYYMNDHLGSRRVLYSSQGEIGDDYYPFGEIMQHQGNENG